MFGFGVENTLLNWSNNMDHISVLLSVNRWVSGCKKGPIAIVDMLYFLAYLKKKLGSLIILVTARVSSQSFSLVWLSQIYCYMDIILDEREGFVCNYNQGPFRIVIMFRPFARIII